ncbi:MAG: ATP-binding protein [Planctomycetota bacterium]
MTLVLGCALLALVFWRLHRAYAAPHLRLWALAWVCGAVHHFFGAAALSLWQYQPASTVVRTAQSVVTQLGLYWQLGFMVTGALAAVHDRAPAPRHVRAALAGSALAVLALTLATLATSPALRFGLRVVLPLAIAGLLLLPTSILLLRGRTGRNALGRLLVGCGFAALAAASWYEVAWLQSRADGVDALSAVQSANLLLQFVIGLGLAIWALEVQAARIRTQHEDLAERTRQLQEAQRMEALGRLAGGVAHDFNNALTVITAIGEHIQQRGDLDAAMHQDLGELRHATRQAARVTSQLLALARGAGPTRRIDLAQAVADSAGPLARLLGERHRLVTAIDEQPCTVRLQSGQAEQVLFNLVVNARDASPTGSTIEVSVQRCGGEQAPQVALTVRDTGIGMTPEVARQALAPWFSTKGERGTGLGLAGVHGIAQQAHGSVTIDSAPGRGPAVRVQWPAVDGGPDESESRRRPPPAAPRSGTPRTILLTEDEPAVLETTARTLRTAGYDVLTATCAEGAVALARSHPGRIDALLTDVLLPGMNGPDLAAQVQAERPQVKVLFVSGYVDARTQAQMREDAPLLGKPFTRRQLLRYLETHLTA